MKNFKYKFVAIIYLGWFNFITSIKCRLRGHTVVKNDSQVYQNYVTGYWHISKALWTNKMVEDVSNFKSEDLCAKEIELVNQNQNIDKKIFSDMFSQQ